MKIEFGIDLIYFADFGIITKEIANFKLNNKIFGYGFGFRFFSSGLGVLSIDFGFNPYDKKTYLHF